MLLQPIRQTPDPSCQSEEAQAHRVFRSPMQLAALVGAERSNPSHQAADPPPSRLAHASDVAARAAL
jgi:hypothetical protein